jgi:hypothetical protein
VTICTSIFIAVGIVGLIILAGYIYEGIRS